MSDFLLRFSGLRNGSHEFHYKIGAEFFDQIDELSGGQFPNLSGDVNLMVRLEKKETMLVLDFEFDGSVQIPCALCLMPVSVPITFERRIIGKYSDEETWHEDEVVHIKSHEHTLDLTDLIYQFITLEIPIRVVHQSEGCDADMINEIERRKNEDNDKSTDPRWEALKKLK